MKTICFVTTLITALVVVFPMRVLGQTVAVGGRHSLVICADSTVQAWGYNGYGQLGNGSVLEQHTGTQVAGLKGIRYVSGGLFHSLFVKTDGTAWSCGRNSLGPLGDATNTDKTTPVQVLGLTEIVQVAGGGEHSLFLKSDGTVWSCGANSSGQLGDATSTNRNIPVQVKGLSGVVQIAAGAEFSIFLTSGGQVWACGHNGYGQFGNGTKTSSNMPVLIAQLSDVAHISAGEWHSIFVKKDGTVYTTGRNNYGQLGDGTLVDKTTAAQVASLNGIVSADAGGIHSVFVKNDGTVWSCGLNSGGNNDGQLGDGTTIDKLTPVQVLPSWGSGNVLEAQAAREHSLYVLSNSQVWSSGRNNYGQLGYGSFTSANSSTSVHASTICTSLPTSVPFYEGLLGVSVFPNPFSESTTVKVIAILPNAVFANATLTVYNNFGQNVFQFLNISGRSYTLHRNNLPTGSYYVRLIHRHEIIATMPLMITD